MIREYYIHKIDGSQGTASSKGREKENLSDDNNQLKYPYIEEDDSKYISSSKLFTVLI